MEAADKWDSGISKGSGQIVSFEYDIAGAFDRTEETKQISVQNINVSDIPNVWIVFLNIHFLKCTGAFSTIGFNFFSGVRHGFKVYPGVRFMSGLPVDTGCWQLCRCGQATTDLAIRPTLVSYMLRYWTLSIPVTLALH